MLIIAGNFTSTCVIAITQDNFQFLPSHFAQSGFDVDIIGLTLKFNYHIAGYFLRCKIWQFLDKNVKRRVCPTEDSSKRETIWDYHHFLLHSWTIYYRLWHLSTRRSTFTKGDYWYEIQTSLTKRDNYLRLKRHWQREVTYVRLWHPWPSETSEASVRRVQLERQRNNIWWQCSPISWTASSVIFWKIR